MRYGSSLCQLKRMHALNKVTVRRKMKVTAHVYLSILAWQIKSVPNMLDPRFIAALE